MIFETKKDVLNWYESNERALTPKFISDIKWDEVKNHPLDKSLIPVLIYMRDIEILTEMYHQQLLRTPTGKDKVIGRFMERWGVEEITHGELINRFLNECGYETPETWSEDVKRSVTTTYHAYSRLLTSMTNCIGKTFTATHMAYGAINELSAAQSYRRLMDKANHPILTQIIRGIIKEESAHTQFYLSVARLELEKSDFAKKITRFVINNFWAPVGTGARPRDLSDYAITKLFSGREGIEWVDRLVTKKIRLLPGLEKMTRVTDVVKEISLTSTKISHSLLETTP